MFTKSSIEGIDMFTFCRIYASNCLPIEVKKYDMYCRKKMIEKTWKKGGQRVTQTCDSSLWKHVRGLAESRIPPAEVWRIWESFQKKSSFFHIVKCFVKKVIGILIEIVEKNRFSNYQKVVNLGFPYSLGYYSIRKATKRLKESDIVFSKSISMPRLNRYDIDWKPEKNDKTGPNMILKALFVKRGFKSCDWSWLSAMLVLALLILWDNVCNLVGCDLCDSST